MNPVPQEIKYCVVCDKTLAPESSDKDVCSAECRVIFADFEVLYSFKECVYCHQPVMAEEESEFCSEDCSLTHEYYENLRTHCHECNIQMPEPITSTFCSDKCEIKFISDLRLEEHENYIESMRQQHVEEDYDY